MSSAKERPSCLGPNVLSRCVLSVDQMLTIIKSGIHGGNAIGKF